MSGLGNTVENLKSRLNENVKITRGQADRIESWIRDFEALVGSAEKIEAENIQLKKDIEELKKDYEKKLAELAKSQNKAA